MARSKRNRAVRRRARSLAIAKTVGPLNVGAKLAADYVKCLADPFRYPPVRLGWGCMTPTSLISLYQRTYLVANADGTAQLAALPTCVQNLMYWNGGAGVTYTAFGAAADSASVQANYKSARVIAVGLRVIPNVALTAASGWAYTMSLAAAQIGDLKNWITTTAATMPDARQCLARDGCSVMGRPFDVNSFAFLPALVSSTGLADTAQVPFTVPIVSFQGLPASAQVAYEVIVHMEAIPLNTVGGTSILRPVAEPSAPRLSDHFPSVETMWGAVRDHIPDINQAYNMLDMGVRLASTIGGALTSVAQPVTSVRNLIGASAPAASGFFPQRRGTSLIVDEL